MRKKERAHSSKVFEINVKAIRRHGPQLKDKPHFQLFAEDVGTSTQTHTSYVDICNTVAGGVEMLCHRKTRGVFAYASQMLTNSPHETSPSLADVNMGASAAGNTVHKIFRSAGEMIANGEGAFTASSIGERSDELAGLTPGALTCMRPRLSVECTTMSLRLRSRLYATIGGCGKMSRVCWSLDRMRKF